MKIFYLTIITSTIALLFIVGVYCDAKSDCVDFLNKSSLRPDLTLNSIEFSIKEILIFKFNTLHKEIPVIPWSLRSWGINPQFEYHFIWVAPRTLKKSE
ncbi:hypothetical protein UABAM_02447 [Candidatus Uabimicrobium amorphum]|uniref:Uncharacterized protein n=1 Tax=Uabimicrobium amorphum TaxID=2596890 RepID=A0A5S9F3C0_UABAM|nr:hypothetical protein UABAM_02447 [Candidatus Uabimicrobium amorphum]